MKPFRTSHVAMLVLAALAAAAPQRASEAASLDLETRDSVPMGEPGNQASKIGQHDLQRRDVEQVEDAVMELINKKSNYVGTRNFDLPQDVQYACHRNSMMVSTNWLWEQTETKIDYLERAKKNSISSRFPEAAAGLEWNGWEDGTEGTTWYNWVDMVFAWDIIGRRQIPLTRSVLRIVVANGIALCNVPDKQQPRTAGFAAKIGSDFVVYLYVAQMSSSDKKHLENVLEEKKRLGLYWQTPDQVSDEAWDEFVRTTNYATKLGEVVKNETLSDAEKAAWED